jgi:ABC-type molybdate transport system substrate-binding protein
MAPQVLFIANVKGRANSETEKFVKFLSTEKAAKLFFSNGFEIVSTQAQAGKK